MVFYQQDPFRTPSANLRARVNPYLNWFIGSKEATPLPLQSGEALRGQQGMWRERIAEIHGLAEKPQELIVEVGCHFGKTLAEMAAASPEQSFIGIDVTYKRVVKTAQKIKSQNSKNAISMLVDGRLLHMVFAEAELDGLVVFFPDPWTKRSQTKHRLLQLETLKRWMSLIKDGGFFWLKTDQKPYFDEVTEHLLSLGFTPKTQVSGLLSKDFVSTFEAHFRQENLGCYGQIFQKSQ